MPTAEYRRAWRQRNLDRVRKYAREWARKNRASGTRLATERRYRAANRERLLTYYRRLRGLPEPTRPCPANCENCGKTQRRALALDHDHATGRFRGWLCSDCNTGIGKLGDTIEGLKAALKYLEAAKEAFCV